MITIPTYLDRSTLAGIGIFAKEPLLCGEAVWEFNALVDLKFTPQQWRHLKEQLAVHSFENLRTHSYKEKGFLVLCMDNARFMNHSSDRANVIQDGNIDRMYAARDISAGEELLCDYAEYSDRDDFHIMSFIRQPAS